MHIKHMHADYTTADIYRPDQQRLSDGQQPNQLYMPPKSLPLFLAAVLCFTCLFFTWLQQFTVNQPLCSRHRLFARPLHGIYETIYRPSAPGQVSAVDFLFVSVCAVQ